MKDGGIIQIRFPIVVGNDIILDNMPETHKCKISGQQFVITDDDIDFYNKIGVPFPTLCPEERERRRKIWRNERHLFKRECGLCGKSVISLYSPESGFPIYCEECFWGDKWDPQNYGQEYDFNRPFFEQFHELLQKAPRLAISHSKCLNSDYAMNCIENKNCYLTSGADYNEDCMYGINSQRSKDCIDHYWVNDSQLTYGCLDGIQLFNCVGCQECQNVNDSWFLYDCRGCMYCAFSANLRNKKHVLFNEQLDEEEYKKRLSEILPKLFDDSDWMDKARRQVRDKAIHRHALILNGENVLGNHIRDCKNAQYVFDAENLEDCKYVYYGLYVKDSVDVSCIGFECSLAYELISACNNYNSSFGASMFYMHNSKYCVTCFNCTDLFGCVSLRNHVNYCVLNKQYSKEEYEELVPRIIKHMHSTGEWGGFFPAKLSPFEYNRSMAIDYMPISREEALQKGFKWFDGEEKISEATGDSCSCELCGKSYRIIEPEAHLYKKMNVPKPKFCWACRLKKLIMSRNPNKLFANTCKKCGSSIQTPIAPNRLEKVYCEKCYLASIV